MPAIHLGGHKSPEAAHQAINDGSYWADRLQIFQAPGKSMPYQTG
jgi:hypothetical protein